jgi:DNA-binding NtrC family response regulator
MRLDHRVLLLVDDDVGFRMSAADAFRAEGATVVEAGTRAEALAACARGRIDVVILDQQLPDGPGVEICPALLAHDDRIKIIAATAYPEFSHAVAALRAGAFDYVSKPVDLDQLEHVISRALKTSELEAAAEVQQYQSRRDRSAAVLVGGGGLAEVRRLADIASRSEAPVLVTGETGTGKNVLARYIHFSGSSPEAPFVAVNAGAIPAELVESELFGHERGAFTGAARQRRGVFEMADGGTLFLDEIGNLSLEIQAKLLTVLDERQIRRVGGEASHPVRVRIIAATNADLEAAVRARAFREDLYYRLDVIHLHMPPLRERLADLGALCRHLVAELGRGRALALPDEELERLAAYPWPGNVRELRNVLERAITLEQGSTLRPSAYLGRERRPPTGPAATPVPGPGAAPTAAPAAGPLGELVPLADVERAHVLAVLRRVDGNLARAARVLEVSESTLRRKLQAWGRAGVPVG